MNENAFMASSQALAKVNNLALETACHYMSLIGDTPEMDETGKAIVHDEQGRELARVFLDEQAKPETARIVLLDGRHTAVIRINGRLFRIETKPSLLDLGIAAMEPLSENLEADYSAPVEFRATLPADPEDGRMEARTLDHFTDAPGIVALAREFHALATTGHAKPGELKARQMITITITEPSGASAKISNAEWVAANDHPTSGKFAEMLQQASVGHEQSYLPHPLLEWAKSRASRRGWECKIEGEPGHSESGTIH